jgi:hypothetical protein
MRAVDLFSAPSRAASAPRRKRAFVVHSRVEEADEVILARVAGGDRDAFARVFAKFAPKV